MGRDPEVLFINPSLENANCANPSYSGVQNLLRDSSTLPETQYRAPDLTEKYFSRWQKSVDLMWDAMQNPAVNQHLIKDGQRAFWEYARFKSWKFSREFFDLPSTSEEQGESVLMAPGYFASPLMYVEVAGLIKSKGHHPEFSYLHQNEFSWDIIEQMKAKTLRMVDENGGEQITLYAHSKGGMDGILVGELINEQEGAYPFKKHIDISSPIYLPTADATEDGENALYVAVEKELLGQDEERYGMTLYEAYTFALSRKKPHGSHLAIRNRNDPIIPEISSTPTYYDGVTVEVDASHCGMIYHPEALKHTIYALSSSPRPD